MSVEERACDTCFTREELMAHPDYVMRVTRDSIERQQRKDQFTEDPRGVAVCMECGFTSSAHRRDPPPVVVAGPPPVRVVATFADIRELSGINEMPDALAVLLLDRYLNAVVNADTIRLIKIAYNTLLKAATTSTRMIFNRKADVTLGGPVDPYRRPHIVTGMHKTTGRPCIVKFISPPDASGSAERLVKNSVMELKVVALTTHCADLVQCSRVDTGEEVTSDLHGKQLSTARKIGIVMDHYPTTAARYVPIHHDALAARVEGIVRALTYLHGKGVCHCDVHADNIFIAQDGAWQLGDFDAARHIGEDIIVTTPRLHLTTTRLDVATPEHDWGMLLGTVALLLARKEMGGPDAEVRIPQVEAVRSEAATLEALDTGRMVSRGEMAAADRDKFLGTATGELAKLIARIKALAKGK